MKPIPNTGSFTALMKSGAVYVDKTKQIADLISYGRVFFSRPRRFGKSLALDAAATLFEKGVDPYFKGTWIHDHWTDGTYPVLKLSFIEMISPSFEAFQQRFCDRITAFAKKQGLKLESQDETPDGYMLALLDHYDVEHQIVIVIDEYDCMLTSSMNDETEYTKYINCIRAFYGVLKDKAQIRFLGITGVTRLKNVSIFSVGSDIRDATYYHSLADLTGYTRDEILKYFKEYVLDIVQKLNHAELSLDDITEDNAYVKEFLDRLALEYDGYCFDKTYRQKVYSTWSVNNFFEENSRDDLICFGDYWFDNGGMPSILKNYLETHDLDISTYLRDDVISPNPDNFTAPLSLVGISPTVLMCQTGYLTLRSTLEGNIRLGIPNNEVRKALAKRLYYRYAKCYPEVTDGQREILEHGTGEEILALLNALLNTLSYENYPIRDESSLRAMLHCFFLGALLKVSVEKENAKGRSDLELEFPDRRLVFELKFVEDSKDADKALDAATAQIEERDYGNTLPQKKELMRLALVFDGSMDQRKFTHVRSV